MGILFGAEEIVVSVNECKEVKKIMIKLNSIKLLASISLLLITFTVHADIDASSRYLLPQENLQPELLVFVSFSMPKQSLKLWKEQVKKVNGKLLLRGFKNNSLSDTTQHILSLFGEEPDVDIAIDPESFQQFNIQVVPTIVITHPESMTNSSASPIFDKVSGDTSLEKALERIEQGGSLAGKEAAHVFLKRYREVHD